MPLWASACASNGVVLPSAPLRKAQAKPVPSNDALELSRLLPARAERCVVSSPLRVARQDRTLVALLSQTDEVPWALSLPVSAYARAELQPGVERRQVIEYVRFAEGDAARIRRELDRATGQRIQWEPTSARPCANELTCVAVRGRFLDAHTVMVTTGPWSFAPTHEKSPCTALLEREHSALEVSARSRDPNSAAPHARGSEIWLQARRKELARVVRRHFVDAAAAEAALRKWLSGQQDLPTVAGIPVDAVSERVGSAVLQRATVAFEDLWLAVEDQTRLRESLAAEQAPEPVGAVLDLSDADVVRSHVDRSLDAVARKPPEQRGSDLDALDQLLSRARREHPADDGLSRRHYALRMEHRRDACAALEVAEAQLSGGGDGQGAWRLAQRRALAGCDEARLRTELMRAHQLGAQEASRMSGELVRNVAEGRDYERSEWAYLTALGLHARAKRHRLSPTSGRIPLRALPRVIAYLGRTSQAHEAHDFGVHVLAFGEQRADVGVGDSLVWTAETHAAGRPGVVFAAATWEDGQLQAEGRALSARFADGPLDIIVGLDPIAAHGGAPERGLLRLQGHLAHETFVIERVSRALASANWERLDRYLTKPLEHMRGAQFPPDELFFQTEGPAQVEVVVQAAEVDGAMRCTREGADVRCRGPLDDTRGASRALVRVARSVLGREAGAVWGGAD